MSQSTVLVLECTGVFTHVYIVFHTLGVKTVHSSRDSDVTESLNVTELLDDCNVRLQCY